MKIIICGIDRLGKGTLINNILKHYGPHPVIHCSSPPKGIADPAEYQKQFFKKCFRILDNRFSDVIFDRCHLGEYVYGPLYRKTDPNFIFNIESFHQNACEETRLVLLCTDDFSIMKDDGLSFDYAARDKEQDLFFEAFQKSKIQNKYMLKVNNGNQYRNETDIFNELKGWIDSNEH
jgi:thymidylate kinase